MTIIVAPPIVTTEGASVIAGLAGIAKVAGGGVVVVIGEEVGDMLELEPSALGTLFLRPVNATNQVFEPPPVTKLVLTVFPLLKFSTYILTEGIRYKDCRISRPQLC